MLRDLNDEQKNAVEEEENILLTACPGSGKTRTLTYKIAYELKRLPPKKYILALTYTNRASDEITERLLNMGIETNFLYSGTIHSFCMEWIIKPYKGYIPEIKNGYQIADEYITINIIDEVKTELRLKSYDEFNTRYDRNGLISNESGIKKEAALKYHTKLQSEKLIDFDMILYLSYKLLKNNSYIAKTIGKLFHYICVDEYQDTQDLQYGIIGELIKSSEGNIRLFIVGDKNQSIYNLGIAKNDTEISDEIGGFNVKKLNLIKNYRSSQRIVDFINNFQYHEQTVEAHGKYKNEKGIITFSNKLIYKDILHEEIAKCIRISLQNRIPQNEICVVAPQWWLVSSMARKLKKLMPDINFDAPGLAPFSKNPENVWYCVARLALVTPSTRVYLLRRKWAKELIEKLMIYEGYKEEFKDISSFLRLINSIKPDISKGLKYLESYFKTLMERIGVDICINQELTSSWVSFFEGAKRRINNSNYDIPDDIEYFKKIFKRAEGVVVSSCHGVKGEEYETVIAFGLLRGYIPNWRNINFQDSTYEIPFSNKLLYVICSRAKRNLHLISEIGRKTQKRRGYETNRDLKKVNYDYDLIDL